MFQLIGETLKTAQNLVGVVNNGINKGGVMAENTFDAGVHLSELLEGTAKNLKVVGLEEQADAMKERAQTRKPPRRKPTATAKTKAKAKAKATAKAKAKEKEKQTENK